MTDSSEPVVIRVKSLENVAELPEADRFAEKTETEKSSQESESFVEASERAGLNHFHVSRENLKPHEISVLPHQKGIKLWNLLKIKRRGYMFYQQLMSKYNSSLFKLRMNTDRILLNDHKSISVMYDTQSVRKEQGFGFMNYNSLMLKDYVPAIFSNDTDHTVKKHTTLMYIDFALANIQLEDIVNMVAVEFKNMPTFENLTSRQSKKIDFEDIFDKAVGNVITRILLGSSIEHNILEEWLSKTLEFQYTVDLSDEDEIKITNTVFDKVKKCPHIRNLPRVLSDTTLSTPEALREVIWMTAFNAFGGTKSFVISSLISFLTLSLQDKNAIVQEAENFLSKESKTYDDLYNLKNLHCFFLEVARLYPPAATVYGRTTKNLLVSSTTGKYFVPSGNLLCGNLMAVHRDPNLFEKPEEFSLKRPEKLVTENNYTFGGRYHEISTKHNHKCPGKQLAEIIVKVFTVFITKCYIVPTERPHFSGKNMGRFEGSDKPLKVKSFRYLGNTP